MVAIMVAYCEHKSIISSVLVIIMVVIIIICQGEVQGPNCSEQFIQAFESD